MTQHDEFPMPRKLWEHPDPQSTNMARFMRSVNEKRGMKMKVRHPQISKSRQAEAFYRASIIGDVRLGLRSSRCAAWFAVFGCACRMCN